MFSVFLNMVKLSYMGYGNDSFFFGPLAKNFQIYDKTMTLR
ncbi:hypothetical protein bwei_5761 [Bacillus mycoides]|nr:hypothetical protein bwei_5761 [Bacillus mycoides]